MPVDTNTKNPVTFSSFTDIEVYSPNNTEFSENKYAIKGLNVDRAKRTSGSYASTTYAYVGKMSREVSLKGSSFYSEDDSRFYRFLFENFVVAQGSFFAIAKFIKKYHVTDSALRAILQKVRRIVTPQEIYIELITDQDNDTSNICLTFKINGSIQSKYTKYHQIYRALENNKFRNVIVVDVL